MIVKDESKVITRCLESVKGIIDYWVIVDTGSTDGTQEIIRNYLKDIPGELHERAWVNFAHNRNEALILAKDKADYLLFIDADEKLIINSFNKNELTEDHYFIEMIYDVYFSKIFLTKYFSDLHWVGVLHECLTKNSEQVERIVLDGVLMDYREIKGQHPKNREKHLKDIEILEKAVVEEPYNVRYILFLAQTYAAVNDFYSAIRWHQRRVELGGEDHHMIFASLYFIGCYQEALRFSPKIFLESYWKAYKYNTTKLEPLYKIARYFCSSNNYIQSYSLAKTILNSPIPHRSYMIDRLIYEYGTLALLAHIAHSLGKWKEAIEICKLILKKEIPKDVERFIKKIKSNCEYLLNSYLGRNGCVFYTQIDSKISCMSSPISLNLSQ